MRSEKRERPAIQRFFVFSSSEQRRRAKETKQSEEKGMNITKTNNTHQKTNVLSNYVLFYIQ